jgi:hypothetical protein
MVNCATNASRCQGAIMATVTQALSATAIRVGMVCFVEMVRIIRNTGAVKNSQYILHLHFIIEVRMSF